MKRVICLLLAAVLLTACAALPGQGPASSAAATLPPAPTAAPQHLAAGGPLAQTGGAAAAALAAYAAAMDVQLELGAAEADLLLLDAAPTAADGCLDLSAQPLLAAAAVRAGLDPAAPVYALPLGRSLYGYWADGELLAALLGPDCLTDVQNASWKEWQALAAALTAWLAKPSAAKVTLNGQSYLLPAQRPQAAQALAGVFALPPETDAVWAGAAAAYTAPLLAAGAQPSAQALTGPLNGLGSALLLERDHAAPAQGAGIAAQLQNGTALFGRLSLADLAAACTPEFTQRLVCLPFKGDYTEDDLATGEYNLTGLMDYPILAGAGYLAIPADADEAAIEAAAAAMLWLYGSAQGEGALIDGLLLITPWDTAADTTPPGAMQVQQVEAGILPGAVLDPATVQALAAAWQAIAQTPDRAQALRAFRTAALTALAPAAG